MVTVIEMQTRYSFSEGLDHVEHSRLREHLALGRFDDAKTLIASAAERGVNLLDFQTYLGTSVLLKVFACRDKVFQFLLDQGAGFVRSPQPAGSDLEMFSESLLQLDVHFPAILELVNRYGVEQVRTVDANGWTFTHSAALFSNLEALKYLERAWPESFEMRDHVGDTPGDVATNILRSRSGRLSSKEKSLRSFFERLLERHQSEAQTEDHSPISVRPTN